MEVDNCPGCGQNIYSHEYVTFQDIKLTSGMVSRYVCSGRIYQRPHQKPKIRYTEVLDSELKQDILTRQKVLNAYLFGKVDDPITLDDLKTFLAGPKR